MNSDMARNPDIRKIGIHTGKFAIRKVRAKKSMIGSPKKTGPRVLGTEIYEADRVLYRHKKSLMCGVDVARVNCSPRRANS